MRNILQPMNIEIDTLEPAVETEPKAEPKTDPVAASERKPFERIEAASRNRAAKARKDAKLIQAQIDEAAEDLAQTWTDLQPQVLDKMAVKLFEARAGGGWKTTDLTEIRQIAQAEVRYKSSDIRKSLTAALEKANELGKQSAQDVLPVQAAGTKHIGWTPAQAKAALQNRVMLLLEDKYSALSSQMYYAIENALVGNVSIQVAEEAIRDVLAGSPFANTRALTILDTAMASAWNDARMSQFSMLENPDGTGATDIIGYEFVAVIDGHTTDQCEELNGKYFKPADAPQPPLHYNCRSQCLPIFGTERKMFDEKAMPSNEASALLRSMIADGRIQKNFGGIA